MSKRDPTDETAHRNSLCQNEILQTRQTTKTYYVKDRFHKRDRPRKRYVKERFYKRDRPQKLTMSKIESTNETDHENSLRQREILQALLFLSREAAQFLRLSLSRETTTLRQPWNRQSLNKSQQPTEHEATSNVLANFPNGLKKSDWGFLFLRNTPRQHRRVLRCEGVRTCV